MIAFIFGKIFKWAFRTVIESVVQVLFFRFFPIQFQIHK